MKLLIIDGMALLFRSYYALSRTQMTLPDGTPSGAIYGFLKIILKLIKEQKPTHFVITWDLPEPTFRHIQYPEYKAHRGATPDDLIPQIKKIQEIVRAAQIPHCSHKGFEGDDCAGTLAKWFSHEYGGESFIVSSDKDFMQLVDDKIKILSLKSGDEYEIIGRQGVIDYFGTPPERVIEILSLIGDSSDNIPGVKGIGPKGATKLITEFGTLNNIYENIDRVENPRTKTMLLEHKEDAFLSHELVTINTQVPIDKELKNYELSWDQVLRKPEIRQTLQSLSMTSLVKMLQQEQGWSAETSLFSFNYAENTQIQSAWGDKHYQCITRPSELDELIQKCIDAPVFSFDTETTGLDIIEDRPIGYSLSLAQGKAWYVPAHSAHTVELPVEYAWQKCKELFERRKGICVAHNLKFDRHMLQNVGVKIGTDRYACTMIAAWLLSSNAGPYGLDPLTLKYFNYEKIPTSDLMGKKGSMLDVSLEKIFEYAAEDADATLRLWKIFEEELKKQKLNDLFWTMEMPVLSILADMERHGVNVDTEKLKQLEAEVHDALKQTEALIYEAAGCEFNIASPKQLGSILFETLKIHETLGYKGKLAKTSLGFKTDIKVLEQFDSHPIVQHIMEFRELSKLQGTYISSLPKLIKQSTKRIHTQFHQNGTATGRLSSTDPNLQNIPIRTVLGKRIRAAFCPAKKENILMTADYSQIELRVLAHMSQDPAMIEAFLNDADIHRQTAAKLLGKPLQDVSSDERNKAKAINFGIIYGMGAQRLAKEQKISYTEAKAFIARYFLTFTKIRDFFDNQLILAKEQGEVKTFFGRKRALPGIHSKLIMEQKSAENIAVNTPIQGTAADIMKWGMIRVQKALEGLETKMILQVHDELVFEGPEHETALVASRVREALEGAVSFCIPLNVDISRGPNWLEQTDIPKQHRS